MDETVTTNIEHFTHFTQDVETVLSELNLKEDSLDYPDFDVIAYINEMFPTEQSLANIDEVIFDTQRKIRELEAETKDIIHGRWQSEEDGQEMVQNAMQMIKTLFTRIHDVQDRATRSEQMVHEITKDIQQLDQAKRNLTVSITTLNNLILIINALDRLNELLHIKPTGIKPVAPTESKSSSTSSNPFSENKIDGTQPSSVVMTSEKLPLSSITDMHDSLAQVQRLLQPMLTAYHMIPSVNGLARELDMVYSVLAEKFTKELKAMLAGNRSASENASLIQASCNLIELLPESMHVKQDILDWFIGRQLGEYRELFDPSQTAAWVDKISHRYTWLRSNLPAIERKFQMFFPPHWHVTEQLIVEFCRVTKVQLETVMRRRQAELNHNLIIVGIQQTLNFEASLEKVYPNYKLPARFRSQEDTSNGKKPVNPFDEADSDSSEPRVVDDLDSAETDLVKSVFDGLISSCFDAHFDLYLNHVEKALKDQLQNRLIADFTLNKSNLTSRELSDVFKDSSSSVPSSTSSDSGENTLHSATELFLLYKQVIKQTLQLNRGQGFLGLVQLLRHYLSEYTMWVLLAQIPGISINNPASGSGSGTTSLFAPEVTAKMAAFGLSGLSALGIGRGQSSHPSQQDLTKSSAHRLGFTGTDQGSISFNQLLTTLLREDQQAVRLNKDEVRKVCVVLVTSAFCIKTVEDLEKRLKMEVRPPQLASKISFATELEGFVACRSVCVHRLVSDLEAAAEPQLAAMARLPWNNLVQVGDQSVYVTEIVKHLRQQVPLIRDILFSVRATFTQICIKFADTLIARYISSLYRCKPLNTFGAEQLLLDAQSLKSALLQMPVFGVKFPQPPPRSFTNLIHEGLGRAERIIKAVMLPVGSPAVSQKHTSDGHSSTGFIMGLIDAQAAEIFLTSYRQLMPDATATDLQKVLDMKGVKPSEQQLILDAFRVAYGSSTASLTEKPDLKMTSQSNKTPSVVCEDSISKPLQSSVTSSGRVSHFEKLVKRR